MGKRKTHYAPVTVYFTGNPDMYNDTGLHAMHTKRIAHCFNLAHVATLQWYYTNGDYHGMYIDHMDNNKVYAVTCHNGMLRVQVTPIRYMLVAVTIPLWDTKGIALLIANNDIWTYK